MGLLESSGREACPLHGGCGLFQRLLVFLRRLRGLMGAGAQRSKQCRIGTRLPWVVCLDELLGLVYDVSGAVQPAQDGAGPVEFLL